MILFLFVYLSIYGGVHLYAFFKLKKGLDLGFPVYSILAIFMILMVVTPIFVRIFERYDYETLARGLAYVGFTWMGLLFIFISASFFFDIYRLIHFLARMFAQSPLTGFMLSPRTFCISAILFSFVVVIYGYFEAINIRTEYVTVKTDKIPEEIIFEQMGSPGEAMELIGRLFDVAKPDAVYTEPLESGDYTVITASELVVTMGAGYGGGGEYTPSAEGDESGETSFGSGGGGGGGGFAMGRPVAVITVGPEGTQVEPIVDPTKIAIAFFTTFAAMAISMMQVVRFMRTKKLR